MTPLRSLAVLVPLMLLAGCHKSPPKNDQRSASGEVLKGTISDSMIPLGQITSQPPLLPRSKAPTTPEQAVDQGLPETSESATPGPDNVATGAPTPAAPAPASSGSPSPARGGGSPQG